MAMFAAFVCGTPAPPALSNTPNLKTFSPASCTFDFSQFILFFIKRLKVLPVTISQPPVYYPPSRIDKDTGLELLS